MTVVTRRKGWKRGRPLEPGCLVWLALPLIAIALSGCIAFHPHILSLESRIEKLEDRAGIRREEPPTPRPRPEGPKPRHAPIRHRR